METQDTNDSINQTLAILLKSLFRKKLSPTTTLDLIAPEDRRESLFLHLFKILLQILEIQDAEIYCTLPSSLIWFEEISSNQFLVVPFKSIALNILLLLASASEYPRRNPLLKYFMQVDFFNPLLQVCLFFFHYAKDCAYLLPYDSCVLSKQGHPLDWMHCVCWQYSSPLKELMRRKLIHTNITCLSLMHRPSPRYSRSLSPTSFQFFPLKLFTQCLVNVILLKLSSANQLYIEIIKDNAGGGMISRVSSYFSAAFFTPPSKQDPSEE